MQILVGLVFLGSRPAQIFQPIVVANSIAMSAVVSGWARTDKGFQDKMMYLPPL